MTTADDLLNRNSGSAVTIAGTITHVWDVKEGSGWKLLPFWLAAEDGSQIACGVYDPEKTDWRDLKNKVIQARGTYKGPDGKGRPRVTISKWSDIEWEGEADAASHEGRGGGTSSRPRRPPPSLQEVVDLGKHLLEEVGKDLAGVVLSNVLRGNVTWETDDHTPKGVAGPFCKVCGKEPVAEEGEECSGCAVPF